jgi:tRNA pseudouridine38/39 synthase
VSLKMDRPQDYSRWTKEALVKRIQYLEKDAKSRPVAKEDTSEPPLADPDPAQPDSASKENRKLAPKKKKSDNKMDPSKYSTRLVAFKLAYIGKKYGGFEFQSSAMLTTIEEELWKALVKACLIFPENPEVVNWDEWSYSKCGRTDRGVSAFGQVIAVRVRSNRPLPKEPAAIGAIQEEELKGPRAALETRTNGVEVQETTVAGVTEAEQDDTQLEDQEEKPYDDLADEIQYCRILNRILPPDIRMLAWCPTTPEDFSARYNCRERQYRYFFTQPAFSPWPNSLEITDPAPVKKGKKGKVKETGVAPKESHVRDGWLDIEAMRVAAKKFEGVHDFRNFCKIDPSKLLTTFDRNIFECDIVEVKDVETALPYLDSAQFRPSTSTSKPTDVAGRLPSVYYFHVRGSAFLWHQIRCMVAIIFMVGQGLEDPSIIDKLLDYQAEPQRPNYNLASEFPLVLWDCIFPKLDGSGITAAEIDAGERRDAMDWIYLGEQDPAHQHGSFGLVDSMWEYWRERKMDEILAGQLLGVIAKQADISKRLDVKARTATPHSQRVFEGGDRERLVGRYQSLLARPKQPTPEHSYDKEARRKGFKDADEWRAARATWRAANKKDAVADVDEDGG